MAEAKAQKALAEGKVAPEFSYPTRMEIKHLDLRTLKARILVLDFWASWGVDLAVRKFPI